MHGSALYSPYGAFELKAKYQRNFGLGSLITLLFIVLILVIAWAISALSQKSYEEVPSVVIKTIKDLGPPPSIAKKPPQVKVSAPQVAAPKVGIPKPVADDAVVPLPGGRIDRLAHRAQQAKAGKVVPFRQFLSLPQQGANRGG